jgi:DNA-binding response OmpR family regulator
MCGVGSPPVVNGARQGGGTRSGAHTPAPQVPSPERGPVAAQSIPPSDALRVLVADDEPHIRRLLTTVLGNAAFRVDEAVDGREALERFESGTGYDCVILDLMMPGASGLEVLTRIREHPERGNTPVVMLTAKGREADRQAAFEGGADDFLTKPFSPRKLISRIQEIVAER